MPSTVIRSLHYRPERAELDIIFVTGRRYKYRDVPQTEADAFANAYSKGRHFNAHIRDRFAFTEVETAAAG